MSEYIYNKTNANVEKLENEIKSKSYFPKIDGISSDTEKVIINCNETLTEAEQAEIQGIIVNHDPVDMEKIVKGKILKAMDFGKDLMATYGAKNVMAGKTTPEIKQISINLQSIQPLLESGSLNAALSEMDSLVPDELVTQETIDYFKSEITAFLNTL